MATLLTIFFRKYRNETNKRVLLKVHVGTEITHQNHPNASWLLSERVN